VKPPMPRFIHGDARHLPLPDETVDLVVTSPPYFGLRDYGSDQQIGAEPTPQEFIAALIECTREMMRVLKPGGSIFVNLGDKYATRYSSTRGGGRAGLNDDDDTRSRSGQNRTGTPEKSLTAAPRAVPHRRRRRTRVDRPRRHHLGQTQRPPRISHRPRPPLPRRLGAPDQVAPLLRERWTKSASRTTSGMRSDAYRRRCPGRRATPTAK
jgi:SAM-dependent methyltransferase